VRDVQTKGIEKEGKNGPPQNIHGARNKSGEKGSEERKLLGLTAKNKEKTPSIRAIAKGKEGGKRGYTDTPQIRKKGIDDEEEGGKKEKKKKTMYSKFEKNKNRKR